MNKFSNIIISERGQKQKIIDLYEMIPFIGNVQDRQIQRQREKQLQGLQRLGGDQGL